MISPFITSETQEMCHYSIGWMAFTLEPSPASMESQSLEDSLDHIDISAQAGTAYFDNIRLYTLGGPAAVPAPGAVYSD